MNYGLLAQYGGGRYSGWQKQENTGKTIQGKLESVLSRLAGSEAEAHGLDRTDAGVYAYGQVANAAMSKLPYQEEYYYG